MKKTSQYPTVAIIGRTNVGKSTLFNRLIGSGDSLVFEREGVTRDYIEKNIIFDTKTVRLVDTGGFTFKKKQDDIEKRVQEKVLSVIDEADLLLLVCDVKCGITQEDREFVRRVQKTKKPTIVLANKADNLNLLEENFHEFYTLGFDEIIKVSGIHNIGLSALKERIEEIIPETEANLAEKPEYKIAIIGKPNVGKSSLMNLLIKQERSIVSDIAGTTREAISETLFHCGELIQVTDTAGVRRKCKVDDDLEKLMVKSSMTAIKNANLIILMIDASEAKIADQELKLLFFAHDMKKPLLILFNKQDLLKGDEHSREMLEQSMGKYDFILKRMPHIFVSCLNKKNVHKVLEYVQKIMERSTQKINSTELDELIKKRMTKTPLYHKCQILRIFKIRTVPGPVPTFVLHVNHPDWFGQSQLGFIENILRQNYDLAGCPVKFRVQKV